MINSKENMNKCPKSNKEKTEKIIKKGEKTAQNCEIRTKTRQKKGKYRIKKDQSRAKK